MKLLTKEIIKTLPKLYSGEKNPDPTVVVKFFYPAGAATWYITEGEPEGDDFRLFGLCDLYGDGGELGYVMLSELQNFKGRFSLGIERDLHWTPCPLSKVRRK